MYIYRELQRNIENIFLSPKPQGLILTGVIGCGKTTVLEKILEQYKDRFSIFHFSGDDIRFREAVASDSQYLVNYITSHTRKKALLFIDEVQKVEAVFDAIKIAFDKANVSFVVSGSNPDYLNTKAKHLLQRRADLLFLLPLSLPEILSQNKLANLNVLDEFYSIVFESSKLGVLKINIELNSDIEKICQEYLIYGGLPLSYLAQNSSAKLSEIRKVVERGFDQISNENDSVSELIRIELAKIHAREFAYQGIFQRTRLRRRERINHVIDQMINHGYLIRRIPLSLTETRRTYLSILSFIDPGLVSYLTGNVDPTQDELGYRIEGIVHSRLDYRLRNEPLKMELGYFKPYQIDSNGKVKYLPGEIDFLIRRGQRIIPIEVKYGSNRNNFDLRGIKKILVQEKNIPFGIILYGGIPCIDHSERLLFWPWWFI